MIMEEMSDGKKYGLIEDWEYHKLRALHFKNLFDFEQAINELNEAFNKADIKTKKEIKFIIFN